MTPEKPCIFNRNSKCLFKGGPCDHDCDKESLDEDIGLNENTDLLRECLDNENRKLAFSKVVQLLLP